MPGPRLLIFDCDSTLSTIEGIDELARRRGPETFEAVAAATNEAMDGLIAVEAVFGRRLEIIQPTAADAAAIGRLYIETVEPTARATVRAMRERGWTPMILSGGFRPLIRPLADYLGIDRVEAVDLFFEAATGAYRGYDERYPTTRSGGKPEVIAALRRELAPAVVAMVGDGVSDLETKPVVDVFVGYGGVVSRDKVRAGATHFIQRLADLPAILATWEG